MNLSGNTQEVGQIIIYQDNLWHYISGSSKITATYYIQSDDNCGDILLVDHRRSVIGTKKLKIMLMVPEFKRVVPKQESLSFPSYVLHSVDVNKSKNIRISLTTNMQTYSGLI
jgi:hypothetical protein